MTVSRKLLCLLSLALSSTVVSAHEHDSDEIPEGEYISVEPMDSILWTHIVLMMIAFGFIFPIGMILGMTKNRFHVPLQVTGAVIAIVAYFLGHHHKGREFPSHNIHSVFASMLMWFMFTQVGLGVFCKLHIERGILGKIRPVVAFVHNVMGKLMPILAWVQMGFGGITALGFCHDSHLGQCLAHGIMGSAFIGYGCMLAIMMMVGQAWIARRGRSQEFYDSSVITAWGIVNTFTEHRWGQHWSHGDFQHTSMGIVWWCAGLLGLFLSRRNGQPTRNHIPAIVIFLTGWAMSVHAQHLELSTKIHAMFGYALMGAGAARIIEISFVLKDAPADGNIRSFQYLTPFLLVCSGFLFMFANEEQLTLIAENGIDHASYTLVIYSVAFLVFLYFLSLIWLWQKLSGNETFESIKYEVAPDDSSASDIELERQQVREAEEFELGNGGYASLRA
ncbi:hypothetical protein BZA70DRAFT_276265 [Myxozyma melibiosi]|uniref:Protein YTP1 n=1 Tax=Myxozyma melibiosi TaxID=54550 RepID=A0ABR1FB10_9ASCO